jgi:hypothetical protein
MWEARSGRDLKPTTHHAVQRLIVQIGQLPVLSLEEGVDEPLYSIPTLTIVEFPQKGPLGVYPVPLSWGREAHAQNTKQTSRDPTGLTMKH